MSTFLQAQTDLLDYVNRPASEMQDKVKREINNTLRWLQRKYDFKYAQKLVTFTYVSGTLQYNLTDVCGGLMKRLNSVQMLPQASTTSGVLLRQYDYAEIQKERFIHQGRNQDVDLEDSATIVNPQEVATHENYVLRTWKYWAFLVGKNFGLYPTPQGDINLLLDVNMWYTDLVNDTDTNFLLTHCYDALIDLATFRFEGIYIKDDSRKVISGSAYMAAMESIENWDSSVRSEHGFVYTD